MSYEIYNIDKLQFLLKPIFKNHGVKKAILFGSYSKGNATEDSDVDILVDSNLKGLQFVGLVEAICEALDKDVDVLDMRHIDKGTPVDNEIRKTGHVIYKEAYFHSGKK